MKQARASAAWLLAALLLVGGAALAVAQEKTDSAPSGAPTDPVGNFLARVLGSTETEWKSILARSGQTYVEPRLVLFSGSTASACGPIGPDGNPRYCAQDQRIYLDPSIFDRCGDKPPCAFARAFVIAREVGHHVQNLTGVLAKTEQARRVAAPDEAAALGQKLELQADCLAGVWAHHADRPNPVFDPGEVLSGLDAALALDGSQASSNNEAAAALRKTWFGRGFADGTIAACDTFAAPTP